MNTSKVQYKLLHSLQYLIYPINNIVQSKMLNLLKVSMYSQSSNAFTLHNQLQTIQYSLIYFSL